MASKLPLWRNRRISNGNFLRSILARPNTETFSFWVDIWLARNRFARRSKTRIFCTSILIISIAISISRANLIKILHCISGNCCSHTGDSETPIDEFRKASRIPLDDEITGNNRSRMHGYYNGIRPLVPAADCTPYYYSSYWKRSIVARDSKIRISFTEYNSYPQYSSPSYFLGRYRVQIRYLDTNKLVPSSNIYAYNGIPQYQAESVFGSNFLGIREDTCFERFGRFGP
jgi:hypothetical protein